MNSSTCCRQTGLETRLPTCAVLETGLSEGVVAAPEPERPTGDGPGLRDSPDECAENSGPRGPVRPAIAAAACVWRRIQDQRCLLSEKQPLRPQGRKVQVFVAPYVLPCALRTSGVISCVILGMVLEPRLPLTEQARPQREAPQLGVDRLPKSTQGNPGNAPKRNRRVSAHLLRCLPCEGSRRLGSSRARPLPAVQVLKQRLQNSEAFVHSQRGSTPPRCLGRALPAPHDGVLGFLKLMYGRLPPACAPGSARSKPVPDSRWPKSGAVVDYAAGCTSLTQSFMHHRHACCAPAADVRGLRSPQTLDGFQPFASPYTSAAQAHSIVSGRELATPKEMQPF